MIAAKITMFAVEAMEMCAPSASNATESATTHGTANAVGHHRGCVSPIHTKTMLTTAAVVIAPSLVRDPRALISDATVIAIASTGSTIVARGFHRRHGNQGMTAAIDHGQRHPPRRSARSTCHPTCRRSMFNSAPRTVSGPARANAYAAYRAACRGSSAHRIRQASTPVPAS